VSAYVPAHLVRQVRAHFADRCAYCQTSESFTTSIFEIEHIIPRSAGGQETFENLCLACPSCNRFKSSRMVGRDPLENADVALFHPHQHEWSDHFAWSADGTEVLAKTPTGRATVAVLRINRVQVVRVRRMWFALGEFPPTE
jgi:hypothetical protein